MVDDAVPLGRGRYRVACGVPREAADAAARGADDEMMRTRSERCQDADPDRALNDVASNRPRVESSKTNSRPPDMNGRVPRATRDNPLHSNAALILPGKISCSSTIDTVKVLHRRPFSGNQLFPSMIAGRDSHVDVTSAEFGSPSSSSTSSSSLREGGGSTPQQISSRTRHVPLRYPFLSSRRSDTRVLRDFTSPQHATNSLPFSRNSTV
ncbi:hypothetical protein ACHAW5_004262 [Stephanodiscus triporus]|uniref:Uncharacterized protein n=1 Tax=Stephanodiscus triporus TaxID=2934178 RepID=A0ABD3MD23_9STRA